MSEGWESKELKEAGLGSWRQDWDLGGRTGVLEAGLGSWRQDWDLRGRTGIFEAGLGSWRQDWGLGGIAIRTWRQK